MAEQMEFKSNQAWVIPNAWSKSCKSKEQCIGLRKTTDIQFGSPAPQYESVNKSPILPKVTLYDNIFKNLQFQNIQS